MTSAAGVTSPQPAVRGGGSVFKGRGARGTVSGHHDGGGRKEGARPPLTAAAARVAATLRRRTHAHTGTC